MAIIYVLNAIKKRLIISSAVFVELQCVQCAKKKVIWKKYLFVATQAASIVLVLRFAAIHVFFRKRN